MKKVYISFLISLVVAVVPAQIPVMTSIDGPSSVCSIPAAPKTFSTSASNSPMFYTWNVFPSTGVTGYNVTTANATINFPFTFGSYTISCSATNGFGTSTPVTKVVTVDETPTVTFSGSNLTLCQGSSTTLMASSTMQSASSTLTYNWTPSTGLNTTAGSQVVANPAVTTTYTVSLSFGNCNNSASVTVSVQVCNGLNYFGERKPGLIVYPNPSSLSFGIHSNETQRVNIVNQLGQTVRTLDLEEGHDTRVEGLPDGAYFIVTKTATYKVIITR